MRKMISLALSLVLLLQCLTLSGCEKSRGVTVLDGDGQALITLQKDGEALKGSELRAYLEIVLSEAIRALSALDGCDAKTAEKRLYDQGYVLHTAFDRAVFSGLRNAMAAQAQDGLSFGGAVTDLKGHLLAAYSDGDGEINFAAAKTPPYSSFKPLSVYAPALEKGLITWSSTYEDSPYKQINDPQRGLYDWPSNATGRYRWTQTGISTAIKESLNTIAVKCMKDYGVNNSLAFLSQRFGLTLSYEQNKAALSGEEEVIGNVAMGYLYEGVSPVDMAGYYQAFATGGVYREPAALLALENGRGDVRYEHSFTPVQALEPATAFVMNRLLQGVVSPGGTGEMAAVYGTPVGGKTGTGDKGNWFVGFTPQYSMAIWHGTEIDTNLSSRIFSTALSAFPRDASLDYPPCDQVEEAAICSDTGLLYADGCRRSEMGCFVSGSLPAACDQHGGN